jgi:hypothetical protein
MDERIARVIPEHFWAKVECRGPDECWPWRGRIDRYGYGRTQVKMGGRTRYFGAHRAAYELAVGPIGEGLVIDHLCRNRVCQNPRHMEPVTNGENLRRGTGKGLRLVIGATCKNGHLLTEQNTRPRKGRPHLLACHNCEREAMQRWKAKQVPPSAASSA